MKKGIPTVLFTALGTISSALVSRKVFKKKESKIWEVSDKHLALFLMMNQWVKNKQENKSMAEYLVKKGYRRVAIYGMNYVGETLLDELTGSEVVVEYGIDKNADNIYTNVDIVSPEDDLDDVDAIIVTAITYFNEIGEQLNKKTKGAILSLEDILYEM